MTSKCGHKDCGASSDIGETVTFGRGTLDFNGYFDIPCPICARDFEMAYPKYAPCWPFAENVINAKRDRIAAVLIPRIGREHGLERANNIAQTFVYDDEADPIEVALQMLSKFQLTEIEKVATQIKTALTTPVVGLKESNG